MRTHCPNGHDLAVVGQSKRGECKECRRAWNAAWRAEHPSYSRDASAAWRKTNAERVAEYAKAYRPRAAQLAREQRRVDPEPSRRGCAAWRAKNPEKRREYKRARRASLGRMTAETRTYAALVLADPCAYCGAPATEPDHIVPLARGGEHDWSNLTGACRGCNASKRITPLLVWLSVR